MTTTSAPAGMSTRPARRYEMRPPRLLSLPMGREQRVPTVSSSTSVAPRSSRQTSEPTMPGPTTKARTGRSVQLGGRQLAPAAAPGRGPAGTTEAEKGGNNEGGAECSQGSPQGLHGRRCYLPTPQLPVPQLPVVQLPVPQVDGAVLVVVAGTVVVVAGIVVVVSPLLVVLGGLVLAGVVLVGLEAALGLTGTMEPSGSTLAAAAPKSSRDSWLTNTAAWPVVSTLGWPWVLSSRETHEALWKAPLPDRVSLTIPAMSRLPWTE